MKRNILFLLVVLLLISTWFSLQEDSETIVNKIVDIPKNKEEKPNKIKLASDENHKIKTVLEEGIENNISNIKSDKNFLNTIEKIISDRKSKEFDNLFTIDTYDDNTGNIIGSYKVGMLEEIFEKDQLNMPFFDTYQATVVGKSINPNGYMQIDANLEGNDNSYLGLVENKKEEVLSGVLYDYKVGIEYHIEGENGKFKIFPINDDSSIHENDVMSIVDKKPTES